MGRGKAVTEKDVEEWRAMVRRIEATRAKGLTRYPRAPWEYVAEMVGRCPRVVFDYLRGAKCVGRASLPLSPPSESDKLLERTWRLSTPPAISSASTRH